jgi:predicted component of type VI protein secretion system
MVQFQLLSGNKAGTVWVARHFPVRVGRSSESDLQIEDVGVWQDHFTVQLIPDEGFVVLPSSQGVVTVNGAPTQRAVLRHGDRIAAGSTEMRFWLAPTRQRPIWWRQTMPWVLLAVVTAAQVLLMNWLAR